MRNIVEFIEKTNMRFWLAKRNTGVPMTVCESYWDMGRTFAPKQPIENFYCWIFEDPCHPYKLLEVNLRQKPNSSVSFVEMKFLTPETLVHVESPAEINRDLKDIVGIEISDDFVIREILSRI